MSVIIEHFAFKFIFRSFSIHQHGLLIDWLPAIVSITLLDDYIAWEHEAWMNIVCEPLTYCVWQSEFFSKVANSFEHRVHIGLFLVFFSSLMVKTIDDRPHNAFGRTSNITHDSLNDYLLFRYCWTWMAIKIKRFHWNECVSIWISEYFKCTSRPLHALHSFNNISQQMDDWIPTYVIFRFNHWMTTVICRFFLLNFFSLMYCRITDPMSIFAPIHQLRQ